MRVFIALPLPQDVTQKLAKLTQTLARFGGLRVVGAQSHHITLIFFGEKNEEDVEILSTLLEHPALSIPPIQASFGECGQFPPKGNPRVIFINLSDGIQELVDLSQTLHRIITEEKFDYTPEKRRFVPHITLARNKRERLKDNFVSGLGSVEGSFFFDRLVLYESVLRPSGAQYKALKTINFV